MYSILLSLIILAATTVVNYAAPGGSLPFPNPPRLTVPSDATAPKLDGYVTDEKWSDAVSFTGLNDANTGTLSDKDFTGFIKSDGKNLYVAFRLKILASERLVHDRTARDSDVYLDDSWELFLYPPDQYGGYYQVVGNSIGTIFDSYLGNPAWNGKWEIKQHLGLDQWEVEIAIPWEELGQKKGIEGAQWRFGFFINQKGAEQKLFSWTPQIGLFAQPAHAAMLNFQKGQNIISLKSLGQPGAGIINPVLSFKGGPEKTLFSLKPATREEIKKIANNPGDSIRFPPIKGKGRMLFSVLSPETANPGQANFYYSTLIDYDSNPITLKTVNYPSRKELSLEVDFEALDNEEDVQQYAVDFGSGPVTYKRGSNIPWERIPISTASLKPGAYHPRIALLNSKGEKLVTKSFEYTKEGAEPWINNKIGIQKGFVPPPYTLLRIQGGTVTFLDRKMEFGTNGLPTQIISKENQLLKEPIRLEGTFDGKQASLVSTTPFKFSSIAADDSVGTAKVSLGPLHGTLKQTISFDGFCWYELTLKSSGKVAAKDVALEINLPREIAQNYLLTDTDYQKLQVQEYEVAGPLKENKNLPFTPHVWLGNDDVGLAWMAESYKGWQVANDNKVIELIAEKDSVRMRINIVDLPVEISGEFKLSFGLQASPVKPVSARQKGFVFINYPSGKVEKSMVPESEIFGGYDGHRPGMPTWEAYAGLPEPINPTAAREEAKRQKKLGVDLVPYSEFTWPSLGLPEMTTFRGDWFTGEVFGGTAGTTANPEPMGLVDSDDKNYQDFIVWRFLKNWEAYGGSSVYYDLFSPTFDKNKAHKKAYMTRANKTEYPYSFRSVREIARRLYIAYHQKNPDFVCFGHASNLYLPILAFSDAWPVGEQFSFAADKYPEVLPYERYHAWFYGYPLGVKTLFLPVLRSPALAARTELSNYLTGLVFNHNTMFWLCFCDYEAVLPYLRAYAKGQWASQEFLPYWNHPSLTTLDSRAFKVSGWLNPKTKSGLLCIASLSAQPVTASVGLGQDWKFGPGQLTDACAGILPPAGQPAYKPSATWNDGSARFEPYGVLMLNVGANDPSHHP